MDVSRLLQPLSKIDWFRIGGGVCSIILLCLILYGAKEFYFNKPIPIINNTTVQPGATMTMKQGEVKRNIEFGLLAGPLFLDSKIGFWGGLEVKW